MSVTIFGDIADLWDQGTAEAIREWDQLVHDTEGHWYFYPTAAAASLAQGFLAIANGFVDVLRLGEGVSEGTWTGVAEDVLRLLIVAGPAIRLVGQAARGLRLLRVAAAAGQAAGTTHCTWISALRAARQSGYAYFATLDDLARAANLEREVAAMRAGVDAGTTPAQYLALEDTLQALRIPLVQHTLRNVAEVLQASAASARNAFIVAINYFAAGSSYGHTLFAAGGRIVDTTGRVFTTAAELEAVYQGASLARSYPVLEIPHSVVVTIEEALTSSVISTTADAAATGATSVQLALRVVPPPPQGTDEHGRPMARSVADQAAMGDLVLVSSPAAVARRRRERLAEQGRQE